MDDPLQQFEHVGNGDEGMVNGDMTNVGLSVVNKKLSDKLDNRIDLEFWSPPAWHLRSRTRLNQDKDIFFMDSLSKGCIGKLLRGEELVLPVVLLLEETSLLYVNADVCDERDVASVRLRLSDSTDSFYGMTAMILYVCA
ncbi:unnamed protein product [Rotaria sp. Silwood1]|nr:unnamed protein product [Rotaria sp. Silwood1]